MKTFSIFATLIALHAVCIEVFGNEPVLAQATLEWQGRSLSPIDILTPWRQQNVAGDKLIDLLGKTVTARERTTRKVVWTADCSGAKSMRWLSANDEVAYIQVFDYDTEKERDSRAPIIRSISLKDGRWIQMVKIPDVTDADALLGLLAGKDLIFVVSARLQAAKEWPHDKQIVDYRVMAFAVKTGKQMWTKSFKADPEYANFGPYLMASKRPNEAISGVGVLSFLGDKILVCAGSRQAIVCLQQSDGKQAWILERVWEYERGFIGPSVWSHFIARHGLYSFTADTGLAEAKRSSEFDERWMCNIVGGPIVVDLKPTEWRQHPASVFVAVGKARADEHRSVYGSYLQDCRVYEISEEGTVVALVDLPRMVVGSQSQVLGDGIVWVGQNNSILRLEASGRTQALGSSGPGGPDMIGKVSWFREYDPQEPSEWLVTDKAGDPIAFDADRCFRVLFGGFVRSDSKKLFNVPIAAIGLEDGKRDGLLLKVPMNSEVEPPTTNFIGDPNKQCHTFGPYLFGVTGLRTDGDLLSITLGMDNWSAILTFDLGKP